MKGGQLLNGEGGSNDKREKVSSFLSKEKRKIMSFLSLFSVLTETKRHFIVTCGALNSSFLCGILSLLLVASENRIMESRDREEVRLNE